MAVAAPSTFERIRRLVRAIPRGKVMTYGDVAAAAGMPRAARAVGYAMRALGRSVPWQRVLGRRNARSAHITIRDPRGQAEQRRLLEAEGVRFDARGSIDLALFAHRPRSPSKPSLAAKTKPRSAKNRIRGVTSGAAAKKKA